MAENNGWCVTADFARQLERELTAAKEEAQLLQTLLKQRDSENAETLAEAVKIEDERNLLRKRVEAADGLAELADTVGAWLTQEGWMKYGPKLSALVFNYRATEGKK